MEISMCDLENLCARLAWFVVTCRRVKGTWGDARSNGPGSAFPRAAGVECGHGCDPRCWGNPETVVLARAAGDRFGRLAGPLSRQGPFGKAD
jgi:hypothetical protein